MMLMLVPGIAEETQSVSAIDAQKLDATYTLALNNAVYYFRAVCNAALGKLEEAINDLTTSPKTRPRTWKTP